MSINCLIVDDEQGALDILTHYIQKTPFLNLTAACLGPMEALDKVYSEPVDLIFLDIHMPELSGIDFIKLLKGRARVILTTAYSEYALEGYELSVLDYLLKPISFDRFLKAVQKAREQIESTSLPVSENAPAATTLPVPEEEDYIFVKVDARVQKVKFQDILYVEGLGNYVSIYTPSERIVTLLTMKDVEERLPARQFMRIHRSYILSLDRINYIEGNQVFIDKKTSLPLGETYRDRFFKALEEKMMTGKR
ncbi:LytR/AlgR family response regulator transcription factor [Arundinibacter roseus]|uniref:Response regulator transcription factor n=1 Tax=Arundinibacter roseus TaxID=2070510 RepID=A0A4R4KR32_9BACT|nr:LytTR family DNA-binding domain-containing protein [Arundinibacter roseus]TDB68861.1 response regulator transcription factor [Arundinibacter roseus]